MGNAVVHLEEPADKEVTTPTLSGRLLRGARASSNFLRAMLISSREQMTILLVPKISESSAFLRPQGLEVTKSTYWRLPRRGIFWWLQRTAASCPDIKLPVERVEYKNGGVYIGTVFNGQLHGQV